MKNFLFVLDKPAHSGMQLQEMLDIILTTAAFEQSVGLLFLNAGVFQLKTGQQPDKQGLKETASIFNVLELYDVNDLYVEIESLQYYGLISDDLCLPVKLLERKKINPLFCQYHVIF